MEISQEHGELDLRGVAGGSRPESPNRLACLEGT